MTDEEQAGRRHKLRVGEQMVGHVSVHARPGEHPDTSGKGFRDVPAVFQRFPDHFEEMPVLRVHDRGFARAEAEEAGVEQLHALERRRRLYIIGVAQERWVDARGAQFRIGQPANGFNALLEVVPEFVHCAGARHA
jgi:hypothetical protein